jgi:hypothetical protein
MLITLSYHLAASYALLARLSQGHLTSWNHGGQMSRMDCYLRRPTWCHLSGNKSADALRCCFQDCSEWTGGICRLCGCIEPVDGVELQAHMDAAATVTLICGPSSPPATTRRLKSSSPVKPRPHNPNIHVSGHQETDANSVDVAETHRCRHQAVHWPYLALQHDCRFPLTPLIVPSQRPDPMKP